MPEKQYSMETLDPTLRALLVCPVDHGDLCDEPGALICIICGRHYPIIDGIPRMLAEEDDEGQA